MIGSFGFAPPIQRRMAFTPAPGTAPGAPVQPGLGNPAPDPKTAFDLKGTLQKLGLMRQPEPGSALPSATVTAPPMPSGAPLDDPSGAIAGAGANVAGGAPSLGADAAGADGAGIGDFLAALFGG